MDRRKGIARVQRDSFRLHPCATLVLRHQRSSVMDFLCYLHEGWHPLIRPAEPTRPWMDATPEAFAYRCLPLNIANAHGWEILTPVGFEAYWRGGSSTADVIVRPDAGMPSSSAPVSLFGQGDVHHPHPGAVPHAAGLEPVRRRLAEQRQGRHRPAVRCHRDRLGALHLHHELALHPAEPLGPIRGGGADLFHPADAARCPGADEPKICSAERQSRRCPAIRRLERSRATASRPRSRKSRLGRHATNGRSATTGGWTWTTNRASPTTRPSCV